MGVEMDVDPEFAILPRALPGYLWCSGADPSASHPNTQKSRVGGPGCAETVLKHFDVRHGSPQDSVSWGVRWMWTGNACHSLNT